MVQREYAKAEGQVLDAGRALEFALSSGDEFEIQLAAHDLLRVTEARENAFGSVAGFTTDDATQDEDVDPDEELDQILSELEIGQTLLAAGAAVDDGPDSGPVAEPVTAAVPLTDALDQLQTTRKRRTQAPPATAGFEGETETDKDPLKALRTSVDGFLGDITTRTTSVASAAVKGMAIIPATIIQPWLTTAGTVLGEIPKVGALTALGLRALRRAVNALLKLVPKPLRDTMTRLAKDWWDESGAEGLAARLLGVDAARERAKAVLTDGRSETGLTEATDAISKLDSQHDKSIGTIKKILKLLSTLLGPLVASFAAAAAWLYGAAAAGFAAAIAAALWIGRDCLDTGSGWERLDGVQVILGRLSP